MTNYAKEQLFFVTVHSLSLMKDSFLTSSLTTSALPPGFLSSLSTLAGRRSPVALLESMSPGKLGRIRICIVVLEMFVLKGFLCSFS